MVQQLSLTGNIKEALARLLKWITFNTSFSLEMIDFQSSHGQPATFQRFFGWIFYDAAKAHHVVPKVCFCREASPERKGLVSQKLHTIRRMVWTDFGKTISKGTATSPNDCNNGRCLQQAAVEIPKGCHDLKKKQLDPRNLTYIYIPMYVYIKKYINMYISRFLFV